MDGGMMAGMGLWMLLWALVGIALLVLVVIGIIRLVRVPESRRSGALTDRETPEELLRRRYAAGEIDEDEYERRRAGLA